MSKRITRKGWGKPRVQYLVRWKGYEPEWDEWYTEDDLGNAKQLIEDY